MLPGIFQNINVPPQERWHQTQKPLALMRQVVRITEQGGRILDPFAGSGSTLEAALMEGYNCTGIELEQHNVEIIHRRLAGMQTGMFHDTQQTQQVSLLDSEQKEAQP